MRELHSDYPQIKYSIVLAYVHGKKENFEATNYTETIYPDGLERVPYRFAISHRNRWMADKSEIVVCYIAQTFGGAWSAVEYAKKHGKEIINLAKK